jgi:hypothetical protein
MPGDRGLREDSAPKVEVPLMSYTYLASPYSHPDASVRETRYHEAVDCVAWMIKNEIWVYAPIVHCHFVALKHALPTDAKTWQDYNHAMIRASRHLSILAVGGWRESKGVAEEIEFAREIGRPVTYAMRRADDTYLFTTEEPT